MCSFSLGDASKDDHMALFEQKSSESPGSELFLQASLLRVAASEAVVDTRTVSADTRTVSAQHVETMRQSYSRFFVLYQRAGGSTTPTISLLLHHAIGQTPRRSQSVRDICRRDILTGFDFNMGRNCSHYSVSDRAVGF